MALLPEEFPNDEHTVASADVDEDRIILGSLLKARVSKPVPTSGELSVSTTDSLQLFLEEVGRYPLLEAHEEVLHAKTIEAGLAAKAKLARLVESRSDQMSQEGLLDLQAKIEAGKSAKAIMINSNLRLVVSVVKRYRGHGVPFLDLIQEGIIGLNRAVEKFDWRKGYKFSTYATWWIRQSGQRSIPNQGSTIRIPVHIQERITKIENVKKELEASLGREISEEELFNEVLDRKIARDEKQFRETLDAIYYQPLSYDKEPELGQGDEDAAPMLNLLPDESAEDPFEKTEESLRRLAVREALSDLPERERLVLALRFGFDGAPWTLTKVAKSLGIATETVREIEAQAKNRLMVSGLEEQLTGLGNNGSRVANGHDSKLASSIQSPSLSDFQNKVLGLRESGLTIETTAERLSATHGEVKHAITQIYTISKKEDINSAAEWARASEVRANQ